MRIYRKTASTPETSSSKSRLWRRRKSGGEGASAPETSSQKRRLWRRKKSGGEGAVKKRSKPKLAEWRVKGAERFAVAKARMQEGFSRLTTWISYQLYAYTHPCSPLRRRAARRSKTQSDLGATERRIEREAKARSRSAHRRARSLEEQIARDAERAKLLQ